MPGKARRELLELGHRMHRPAEEGGRSEGGLGGGRGENKERERDEEESGGDRGGRG